MLVLTRRVDESIMLGDDIEIKVVDVRGGRGNYSVRIGIEAPRHITVLRKEVYDEVIAENRKASLQVDERALDRILEAIEEVKKGEPRRDGP